MYRVQGTLREWVTRDEVRRFIAKKFKEFLLTYQKSNNDEDIVYVRQINEMVLGKSLCMPSFNFGTFRIILFYICLFLLYLLTFQDELILCFLC